MTKRDSTMRLSKCLTFSTHHLPEDVDTVAIKLKFSVLFSLLTLFLVGFLSAVFLSQDVYAQDSASGLESKNKESDHKHDSHHDHHSSPSSVEVADMDVEKVPETIHDIVAGDENPEQGVPGVSTSIQINADGISPQTLVVSPGATVVWVNKAPHPVRVRFTGRAVSATCQAPRGFKLDTRGIFRSEEIDANGGVASLCFLERNTYVFEVEHLSPKKLEEQNADEKVLQLVIGTIRVEQ